MSEISPVDGAILAILVLALGRGIAIGLIREAFSIAALAGACIAASVGTTPLAVWLQEITHNQVQLGIGRWLVGAGIVVISITLIGTVGRWIRRGARAAGLGWADRLGGAALGTAEGALVVSLLLFAATWAVGTDHPKLAESRGVELFDELQTAVLERADADQDVAAPPP